MSCRRISIVTGIVDYIRKLLLGLLKLTGSIPDVDSAAKAVKNECKTEKIGSMLILL